MRTILLVTACLACAPVQSRRMQSAFNPGAAFSHGAQLAPLGKQEPMTPLSTRVGDITMGAKLKIEDVDVKDKR
eukprot:12426764-Karenia_brevis.AAC.1